MEDSIEKRIKEILSAMKMQQEEIEDDYEGFYESNTYAEIKEYWNKNDEIVGNAVSTIEECYDLLKAVLEELEDEDLEELEDEE